MSEKTKKPTAEENNALKAFTVVMTPKLDDAELYKQELMANAQAVVDAGLVDKVVAQHRLTPFDEYTDEQALALRWQAHQSTAHREQEPEREEKMEDALFYAADMSPVENAQFFQDEIRFNGFLNIPDKIFDEGKAPTQSERLEAAHAMHPASKWVNKLLVENRSGMVRGED
jgi:uncharacterized lipoprotein YddW (UPF0748 family)